VRWGCALGIGCNALRRCHLWSGNEEVKNVAESGFTLLACALASVLLSVQTMGQVSRCPQPSIAASFAGSALTCSQSPPSEQLIVPQSVKKRAKRKARLLNLLRESLYDDSKGIVNLAREKEIVTLANS
jgi:hypothetical protein